MAEVTNDSDSSNSMNVNVRIPALEKLLDYTASGIGGVAGPMLAPWKARQEAKVLKIQAQSRAEVLPLEAEAMAKARSLIRTPATSIRGELNFQERVTQRLQFQEEKRQRNIQDVVLQSAEDLQGKEVPDEEPNHDWVSRFFGDVQDVSSAEMKTLYSKVLTGQIERSGSFSLLALNILKNMDVATAKLFRTLCSACISLMPDGKNFMDIRVPVLNGHAGNNALSPYGLSFSRLNVLNEHGLIISDYNSQFDYQLCAGVSLPEHESRLHIQEPFKFQGQFWVLKPINGREIDTEVKVHGVQLTQAGRELSKVVDIEPMEGFARDLKAAFARRNLQMVQTESSQQQTHLLPNSDGQST